MLSRLPSIARRVAAARLRSASPSSLAGGATVAAAAAAASAAAADASCSMPLAEWLTKHVGRWACEAIVHYEWIQTMFASMTFAETGTQPQPARPCHL